jgi:hypothetical protein
LVRLLREAKMPRHIFLARQITVLLDGAISKSLRNRDGSYAIAAGEAATTLLSSAQFGNSRHDAPAANARVRRTVRSAIEPRPPASATSEGARVKGSRDF